MKRGCEIYLFDDDYLKSRIMTKILALRKEFSKDGEYS